MSARILLIEDDEDLAFGLQRNLEFEGYEVELAGDGEVGLDRALAGDHDLLILDLMLPGIDGLAVLQRVRASQIDKPVLILTAKGSELDKVRGLRSGADDYLSKPFGVLELIARVEALLRRGGSGAVVSDGTFSFGEIVVDTASRTVVKAGEDVTLTPREFELLTALLRRRGAAASRQELLAEVWGHRAAIETRTVDTHVVELRRKLEPEPSTPHFILTVRKFGYRLDPEGGGRSAPDGSG